MKRSPLYELTERLGAVFGPYDGWQLPRRFQSLAQEYDALRQGTVLTDRSHVGRLRLTGKDALDLLHRLSTNDLLSLEPGRARGTVLTTGKGRIVDVVTVVRMPEHLLLLTSPGQQGRVAQWLDTYTFLEECAVQDIGQEMALLSLVGLGAEEALARAAGPASVLPRAGEARGVTLGAAEAVVVRTDPLGLSGYDLLAPWEQAVAVWQALAAPGTANALPAGLEALETARIENGVGRYGREYGEAVNPLEGGLRRLISFTKGCYTGQEVVARLNTYDKVQRKLVGVVLENKLRIAAGKRPRLLVDGQEVGYLTSWARPPRRQRWLALGYLRRAHAKVRAQVQVEADGVSFPARVASLPFRR